jgi:hypothetical protein
MPVDRVRYKHLSIADDDRTMVMPRTLLAYSMQSSLESEESWVQPARTSAPPAQDEQEIETRKKSARELVQQAKAPVEPQARARTPLARQRTSQAPPARARQEQAPEAQAAQQPERASSMPPVVMRADRTSSVPYVSDVDAILPDAPDPHARKRTFGLRFAAGAAIVGVMFTLGMFVGLGSTQAPPGTGPAAASQQTEAVAMVQAPMLEAPITEEPKAVISAPAPLAESIEIKDTPAAAPEVTKADAKPEATAKADKASPRKWVNSWRRAKPAARPAVAKRAVAKAASKDAPAASAPSSAEIDAASTAEALAREQLEAAMK